MLWLCSQVNESKWSNWFTSYVRQSKFNFDPNAKPEAQLICLVPSSKWLNLSVSPMSESPLSVALVLFGASLDDMFLASCLALAVFTTYPQFVRITKQDARFSLVWPDANHLEIEAIAPVLQQLFYELVFFPTSSNHSDPGKAPVLLQLWQGLTGLIRRWTNYNGNRRYCSAAEVISKPFWLKNSAFSTNLPCPMAHSSW